MLYEGISDDLPVEAIVARNMGDEDWEDLCLSPQLSDGCSRAAPYLGERVESARFEAEPVTTKSFDSAYMTRRRFTK